MIFAKTIIYWFKEVNAVRNKSLFLSAYKFDDDQIKKLNIKYHRSENKHESILDLKNNGVKYSILRLIMFGFYETVYLVIFDENYNLVKDLILSFSLLIFKNKIILIRGFEKDCSVSYLHRALSPFKLLRAWLELNKSLRRAKSYMTFVGNEKSIDNALDVNSNVIYLKTNLSFGAKAGGSIGHISGVVNSLALKTNLSYISAEAPIMLNESIDKIIIELDSVVYSIPYELNLLKLNNAFIDAIEQLIASSRVDVLYQRLTRFNITAAYLSSKYNIPYILEYNGSEVWIQNNWGNKKLKYFQLALDMEEYALKSSDVIITVSEVLKDELIDRGVNEEKIVFYPNGVDRKIYDYKRFGNDTKLLLREKLGFSQEDKIFTFIGTFGVWHGVLFLAEAIIKLVEEYEYELKKYNVKFLLIGDGLLGSEIRTMLSSVLIKKYVKFTGLIKQEEAPEYLSISDCFLSPHIKQKTRFIGSPTKLFEYMSFAKPIIASNLDQLGDIFEYKILASNLNNYSLIGNESAILFEPGDYDQFVKSVLFAASYNLDFLGFNAYNLVEGKYTWDNHVDKILDKYNSLVKRNKL